MQTPLLHGGLGYFCFDNGVLTVYRLATGERLYQQRLAGAASGFSSSPVAAGGRLYITNEEGHSYVLALGPDYKLLAENDLGETVMATPAISGDVLYIRGGKAFVRHRRQAALIRVHPWPSCRPGSAMPTTSGDLPGDTGVVGEQEKWFLYGQYPARSGISLICVRQVGRIDGAGWIAGASAGDLSVTLTPAQRPRAPRLGCPAIGRTPGNGPDGLA